jgi:hypothetical protein
VAENGDYKTFIGAGFGTLMIQVSEGKRETPEVVSSRAHLRGALPATYQEEDFGMRFVGALEEVLDPIVAVLDALPAHFDPDFAPRNVLTLLSAWLGVDVDESQPIAVRRSNGRGPEPRARADVPGPAAARRGRGRGHLLDRHLTARECEAPTVRCVLRQAHSGGEAGGRRALH